MVECGQIMCFERNLKTAERIRRFLRENWIFNCVAVNFQNCLEDFILEEGGFIFTEDGFYIEKKGIAEEIARLKGPVIFYGGHSKEGKILAVKKPMKILNRKDSFWVPEALSNEFIAAYWMVRIDMIYKETTRNSI